MLFGCFVVCIGSRSTFLGIINDDDDGNSRNSETKWFFFVLFFCSSPCSSRRCCPFCEGEMIISMMQILQQQ